MTKAQRCFDFKVFDSAKRQKTGREERLNLVQRHVLKNVGVREAAAKSKVERQIAVSTYFESSDVLAQIIGYAREKAKDYNESELGDDIVIGIGSEVVVGDEIENEFEGDAGLDAFALMWDDNPDGTDNNTPRWETRQAAVLSMRRVNHIFPEIIYTDNPERARAIAARYIVANVACFIGNRSFGKSAFHHTLRGCINESAWVGGERESYQINRYCDECTEKYREVGPIVNCKGRTADELLSAIEHILIIPDSIDSIVRSTERFMFWIQFAGIAITTNIVAAMLLDLVLRWDLEGVMYFSTNLAQ